MKIAIPTTEGRLSSHFGHCQHFALFDVDPETRHIGSRTNMIPPVHEPGVLPRWLHELGVTTVIAGGMGSRAQNLFSENGISVIVGAADEDPEWIVQAYLGDQLQTTANTCDH